LCITIVNCIFFFFNHSGECDFNQKKLFCGWVDSDLSERGRREIEHAARLLLERGYTVDITYNSISDVVVKSLTGVIVVGIVTTGLVSDMRVLKFHSGG
jgi:hypothetical protein